MSIFKDMLKSFLAVIRDVNFVFFQKSIIVLKKSIFFRLSNMGVAVSTLQAAARNYVSCRAPPHAATCRSARVRRSL